MITNLVIFYNLQGGQLDSSRSKRIFQNGIPKWVVSRIKGNQNNPDEDLFLEYLRIPFYNFYPSICIALRNEFVSYEHNTDY